MQDRTTNLILVSLGMLLLACGGKGSLRASDAGAGGSRPTGSGGGFGGGAATAGTGGGTSGRTGGIAGSGGTVGDSGVAGSAGADGGGNADGLDGKAESPDGTNGAGGTAGDSSDAGDARGTSGSGNDASDANDDGGTAGSGGTSGRPSRTFKPRVIVTTDGEIDDRSSMVRFLMYASDYDVAGIVQVSSRYSMRGHSQERWIEKQVDLYAQTLSNLKKHNPDFPEASKLAAVVTVGNEKADDVYMSPGSSKTGETAGSKLIVDTLLDNDARPVHIPTWGGARTTAYAFYTLKTTHSPDALKKAVDKAWIYCIWYQDGGGEWIENNIPEARIYEAFKWDNIWDYQSLSGPNPAEVKAVMTQAWLTANVKTEHGVLGAAVPQTYVTEGDTPSFLPLVNNGLDQDLDLTWGGWGGRPVYDKLPASKHMTDGVDEGDAHKPFWRWIVQAQQDFAARMDWAVADDYSKANHNPRALVVGAPEQTVSAGETVLLDGSGSTDPDKNKLAFKWWQYTDADTATVSVVIANATAPVASFVAPPEPGKTVHIILEVTDDGTPPLTNWRRTIFNIM